MLPAKVIEGARATLRRRVARIVRMLSLEKPPPVVILAMQCKLIGDCAWLLSPEAMAERLSTKKALEARRFYRVCVWDGECEADATTDDGLCAAHAAEQAREEAEMQAEIDADVARVVAEQRPSDS